MRLYELLDGTIFIDNKPIQSHNIEQLRSSIGYVPQEVFLFSDSIANNISFGIGNKNQSKIEKQQKMLPSLSNIEGFPEKFETIVGERGITLSGGQKQRISIARAIIKEPQLLIFDDCLSAVDTETEEEIFNNLKSIMKDKTTIIISHRVSSVKNANSIIVIENGCVIEQGKRQELLEKQGNYFNLYKMQLLEEEKN